MKSCKGHRKLYFTDDHKVAGTRIFHEKSIPAYIVHIDAHSDLKGVDHPVNNGNFLSLFVPGAKMIYWVAPEMVIRKIDPHEVLPGNSKLLPLNAIGDIPKIDNLWLDIDLDFLSYLKADEFEHLKPDLLKAINQMLAGCQYCTLALSYACGTLRKRDLNKAMGIIEHIYCRSMDENWSCFIVNNSNIETEIGNLDKKTLRKTIERVLINASEEGIRQLKESFYHQSMDLFLTRFEAYERRSRTIVDDPELLRFKTFANVKTGRIEEALKSNRKVSNVGQRAFIKNLSKIIETMDDIIKQQNA